MDSTCDSAGSPLHREAGSIARSDVIQASCEQQKKTAVSCSLSATGICFLGILSRLEILPLLRSAYRAAIGGADPSGVSVFRMREKPAEIGVP